MHGGVKVYRGAPAAARSYVEADRARVDDYYLAEGTGIAERYAASCDGAVTREAPLTGDGYEAWVAGVDPGSGVAKGHLRRDAHAVRFVEVSVNGPKSWSLAAELHPDISAAYDTAQDAAAQQIIGWLAQHATTRVGPRGGQIQVPVAEIDAVTVRHHTSRVGDPHRDLHLQINARVLAEERGEGRHGRRADGSMPSCNCTRRSHDDWCFGKRWPRTGSPSTCTARSSNWPCSSIRSACALRRSEQCHLDRYEAERRAEPHAEPGPALRRAWDRRLGLNAWLKKIGASRWCQLTSRRVAELHVGYPR